MAKFKIHGLQLKIGIPGLRKTICNKNKIDWNLIRNDTDGKTRKQNITLIIITAFPVLKNLEEILKMLSKGMKNIEKA